MKAILRRLIQIAVVIPLLSFLGFAMVHALPGRPEEMSGLWNPSVDADELARLRKLRGLDRSLWERYGCWLIGQTERRCSWWPDGQGILRGDLGHSRTFGRPVRALLAERLPRTLGVMVPAFSMALILSLALGTWAAYRQGAWPDRLVAGLSMVGLAMPLHWLALMAILILAVGLGWFPSSGVEDPAAPSYLSRFYHAALPIFVTSSFYLGRWLRFVRATVAEALASPFVLALRARGVAESRVVIHATRNALTTTLAIVGHSVPALFSGAVIIERVFVYPGMGTLLVDSVLADEHLVAVAVMVGYAAATLSAALATDIALYFLDPRVSRSGREIGVG